MEKSDGGVTRGVALKANKERGGVVNCAPGEAKKVGIVGMPKP